ncbi:MAG: sugar nucleotide-binding protein [Thermodesulfobacteriota bacterium]
MKILITGASGYIGTRLVKIALANNHQIGAASRRPQESVPLWLSFDLNTPSRLTMSEGIDAVIHLAANTSGAENDKQNEVESARALIAAASKVNARFLFVSSQTAREDAPTSYGRTKWRIEQEVLAASGLVVRLGQVYGGLERGLFGTMISLVRRLQVLPAFMPSPSVQPIHVDDCANGLLRLVELKDIRSDVYCLASPKPISFTEFLRSIARDRVRGRKFFVPVPIPFVRFFTRIIGNEFAAKFGLHRLDSLFNLPPMNTAVDLDTIGLELRPLHSGMHRSGSDNRRRLIQEGIALLTYLLKEKPTSELVRRYVRMIEKLRAGIPLDLPAWLLQWPVTLALLDDRTFVNSPQLEEFGWRVDAAMILGEASIQGADRFLGDGRSRPKVYVIARIIIAVGVEIVWRFISLLTRKKIASLSSISRNNIKDS